jgi:hypothetical protein
MVMVIQCKQAKAAISYTLKKCGHNPSHKGAYMKSGAGRYGPSVGTWCYCCRDGIINDICLLPLADANAARHARWLKCCIDRNKLQR